MPTYLSPGVYVEEVASAVQPIAGVSTSTPGFIGVMGNSITIPTAPPIEVTETITDVVDGSGGKSFQVKNFRTDLPAGTVEFRVDGEVDSTANFDENASTVTFDTAPANGAEIVGYYVFLANQVTNKSIGTGNGSETVFALPDYPVYIESGMSEFKVNGTVDSTATLSEALDDEGNPLVQVTFVGSPPADKAAITGSYIRKFPTFKPAPAGETKLCTNFGEFKKFFGDFSADAPSNPSDNGWPGQNILAHAVYGFFNNGGSRCYVVRTTAKDKISVDFLEKTFEPIDEIAIVVAPGITDPVVRSAIVTHCQQKMQDRFAIFDSPEVVETSGELDTTLLGKDGELFPDNSNYAAFYFPWLQVFDPVTKIKNPKGGGLKFVPPGGHIAGVYARVDNTRGVHKAPANEPILGALGLKYNIGKNKQDGLNPQGVNCIRDLNGNIRVWGARTIGGDANGEWKYVNVRRLFLFLRESIDEGTQWAVFEPNSPSLWAKLRRNINAFLTTVWRDGALFGNTPQEAFYVKCDEETNPPEVRDLGRVITEIGVAPVKPAEFVIFRISQWAGPGQ